MAIYCANCGEYISEGKSYYREPESCGAPECNREVSAIYREMDDQAREEAAADNYERYR